MNWTGFLSFWAVALFFSGIARAAVSDAYGSSRSVWPHRFMFAASVVIGSIAILTA